MVSFFLTFFPAVSVIDPTFSLPAKVTLTEINFDSLTQSFRGTGKVKYTDPDTGDKVTQSFSNLELWITDGSKRTVEQATCDILNLGLPYSFFFQL